MSNVFYHSTTSHLSDLVVLASLTQGSALLWMIGAMVGAVAAAALAYYIHHVVQQRKRNSHPELFRGLCQVHSLDRARRRLLRQVVRVHNLDKPALVFVEPKWIQSAVRSPALQSRTEDLRELQELLFGRLDGTSS